MTDGSHTELGKENTQNEKKVRWKNVENDTLIGLIIHDIWLSMIYFWC